MHQYIDYTEALNENAESDVQMFIHARTWLHAPPAYLHVDLHDFVQKDRVIDLLERAISGLKRSIMDLDEYSAKTYRTGSLGYPADGICSDA